MSRYRYALEYVDAYGGPHRTKHHAEGRVREIRHLLGRELLRRTEVERIDLVDLMLDYRVEQGTAESEVPR